MKTIGLVAVAIALATPAYAAPKVARPAALLAVASRSTPSSLDGGRALVNAVAPNTMQAPDDVVLASLADSIQATHIDGIDRSKPIYVIYADDNTSKGLAVVARVADPKALLAGLGSAQSTIRDGWVALGSKEVLGIVGDYALSTLVVTTPPKGVSATIYIDAVLDRYQGQIAMMRVAMTQTGGGPQMTQLMTNYFDGLMSVAQDTAEIRLAIDANADRGGLDVAFVPKSGSRLAKFVALQQPSDFGLLAKLPETAPMLIAGHATLGPYRQGFIDVIGQMYGAANADMIAMLDAVMQATSGDIAMAGSVTNGMTFTQVFGIADSQGATAAIARILKLMAPGMTVDMSGAKMTYTVSPDVTGHDGVTVHQLEGKIDMAKLPAASKPAIEKMMPNGVMDMTLAMFDKLGVATIGDDV